jgi:hypothetical protein
MLTDNFVYSSFEEKNSYEFWNTDRLVVVIFSPGMRGHALCRLLSLCEGAKSWEEKLDSETIDNTGAAHFHLTKIIDNSKKNLDLTKIYNIVDKNPNIISDYDIIFLKKITEDSCNIAEINEKIFKNIHVINFHDSVKILRNFWPNAKYVVPNYNGKNLLWCTDWMYKNLFNPVVVNNYANEIHELIVKYPDTTYQYWNLLNIEVEKQYNEKPTFKMKFVEFRKIINYWINRNLENLAQPNIYSVDANKLWNIETFEDEFAKLTTQLGLTITDKSRNFLQYYLQIQPNRYERKKFIKNNYYFEK